MILAGALLAICGAWMAYGRRPAGVRRAGVVVLVAGLVLSALAAVRMLAEAM